MILGISEMAQIFRTVSVSRRDGEKRDRQGLPCQLIGKFAGLYRIDIDKRPQLVLPMPDKIRHNGFDRFAALIP